MESENKEHRLLLKYERWGPFLILLTCSVLAGFAYALIDPSRDPAVIFNILLGLWVALSAFIVWAALNFKIEANEEELAFRTWPMQSNRTIRCDRVKAIYVDHFTIKSLLFGKQALVKVHILLSDSEGEIFSIFNTEVFFKPFVEYLHKHFATIVEEGYEASQFDRSRFYILCREMRPQQVGDCALLGAKRNYLFKTYALSCIHLIVGVCLIMSTMLCIQYSGAIVIPILLGLVGLTGIAIWYVQRNYSPQMLIPPSTVNSRLAMVWIKIHMATLLSLGVYLACTWADWTLFWQPGMVIFICLAIFSGLLLCMGHILILRKIEQIWSSAAVAASESAKEKSGLISSSTLSTPKIV
ncbi:hypothetical protein ACA910_008385 [Epithemia clementina (nom. ined.)]